MSKLRRVETFTNESTQRVALIAHTDDQTMELDVCVDDAERMAKLLMDAVIHLRRKRGN